MARKCYVTGLGTVTGNNRPHSLKASRRTWKANLQKVKIKDENGKVKRVYLSTSALRTMEKRSKEAEVKAKTNVEIVDLIERV